MTHHSLRHPAGKCAVQWPHSGHTYQFLGAALQFFHCQMLRQSYSVRGQLLLPQAATEMRQRSQCGSLICHSQLGNGKTQIACKLN